MACEVTASPFASSEILLQTDFARASTWANDFSWSKSMVTVALDLLATC